VPAWKIGNHSVNKFYYSQAQTYFMAIFSLVNRQSYRSLDEPAQSAIE
jgi:hypothetical protein